MLVQALNATADATAFSSRDADKLVALVQAQQSDGHGDSGAPAAAAYDSSWRDCCLDWTSAIQASTTDIEELTGAIASYEMDLKVATAV